MFLYLYYSIVVKLCTNNVPDWLKDLHNIKDNVMCVFLTLRLNKAQVKKQYDTKGVDDLYFGPVFVQSAFSFSPWPVISSKEPDYVTMMNWGLIPHWAKDESTAFNIRKSTVNARVETLSEKPSFRQAVKSGRCLILADGFYEFREMNRKKYPYFIQLENGKPFSLAGIYDNWLNRETGEMVSSFSIITTEANPLMAKIHNRKKRMPVILPPEEQYNWINFISDSNDLKKPFPDNRMEAWTVSRLLTSRDQSSNVKEATLPYRYPELEMLDGLGI